MAATDNTMSQVDDMHRRAHSLIIAGKATKIGNAEKYLSWQESVFGLGAGPARCAACC